MCTVSYVKLTDSVGGGTSFETHCSADRAQMVAQTRKLSLEKKKAFIEASIEASGLAREASQLQEDFG
ncbi:hypothetical protein N7495_009199 [Penicillium taxi]|uniref:uncharacterized protein n=1 Tax=Penicillium taxi TaxID=168475 RepID=UPI002544D7A4|nr:uncharacterized protein N7495_009199 [Penicillium taxi]KAJ5884689.1 hypothetical protein N7495_009199 [Penicillium taxi]